MDNGESLPEDVHETPSWKAFFVYGTGLRGREAVNGPLKGAEKAGLAAGGYLAPGKMGAPGFASGSATVTAGLDILSLNPELSGRKGQNLANLSPYLSKDSEDGTKSGSAVPTRGNLIAQGDGPGWVKGSGRFP